MIFFTLKPLFFTFLVVALATSCTAQLQEKTFKINETYKSQDYNSRIRQIVVHYTVRDMSTSLSILDGQTKRRVSSHYLINNVLTKDYDSYIYGLVDDNDRSWHAGVSEWRGDDDLNNSSIGIEIVNLNGNQKPYPEEQIKAVIFLIKQLLDKYDVEPVNIVGHSDIAPDRKDDPGTFFPWKELFDRGIGSWYDEDDIRFYKEKITELPSVMEIKQHLHQYGYKLDFSTSQADKEYVAVVRAFQRHFAPEQVDGEMSLDDYIILRALLKKYNGLP